MPGPLEESAAPESLDILMSRAVELARQQRGKGERPYGALVVLSGRVVGTGVNSVVTTRDPTCHAEVEAVRAACRALQTETLDDAVLLSSAYPCRMCQSVISLAGISTVYYGSVAPSRLAFPGLTFRELRAPGAQDLHISPGNGEVEG